ncbi:MAG: hypothetical protein JXA89_15490 [Anaerolineae bacterium]|nr:hypothetical protein [Anaerolineae bacterium]
MGSVPAQLIACGWTCSQTGFTFCRIQPVEPGAKAAVFTVPLKAGPTLLHTWFDDARQQPLCGAYYVYVSRLD